MTNGQIDGARITSTFGVQVLRDGRWVQVRQAHSLADAAHIKREQIEADFWSTDWMRLKESIKAGVS